MSDLFAPRQSITGLASGLDTAAILDQLLALERRPKARLEQRQSVEQARNAALMEVKTRLQALRSAASALGDASLWSSSSQPVTSSDASKVAGTGIGTAVPGSYYVSVTRLATAHRVEQAGSFTLALADDTLAIAVGAGAAVDVAVAAGDDAAALAQKINATTGIGAHASVVSGRLVIEANATGAASTISVASGGGGELASALGLVETRAAADAELVVNNVTSTSASNTGIGAIPGLSLDVLATTTTPVTLTVSASTAKEEITKRVTAFADAYNALVDFVSSKLTEERVKNPVTDAERQKGMLRGDVALRSLLFDLRTTVSDVIAGRPEAADQLSDVGLSTGAPDGTGATSRAALAGRLTLDPTKLSALLDSSFEDVKALFTNVTDEYGSEGFAQRIQRRSGPYLQAGGVLDTRLEAGRAQIDDLADRMASLDARLAIRERALRQQFADLEVALQGAQAQSNWLAGQLAGLSG